MSTIQQARKRVRVTRARLLRELAGLDFIVSEIEVVDAIFVSVFGKTSEEIKAMLGGESLLQACGSVILLVISESFLIIGEEIERKKQETLRFSRINNKKQLIDLIHNNRELLSIVYDALGSNLSARDFIKEEALLRGNKKADLILLQEYARKDS